MSGFSRSSARRRSRCCATGRAALRIMVPLFQLVLFGLIDTNVHSVPTAVFDQSRTEESRALAARLHEHELLRRDSATWLRAQALREEIVAARCSVGIEIPPDYARRRLLGEPTDVLVLIDGSDSSISVARPSPPPTASPSTARSSSSLAQAHAPDVPVRLHPLLLFNPDSPQREPAHPRSRRDPPLVLGDAPRGLRDRPRARARHARAAHGDARSRPWAWCSASCIPISSSPSCSSSWSSS